MAAHITEEVRHWLDLFIINHPDECVSTIAEAFGVSRETVDRRLVSLNINPKTKPKHYVG